MAITAKTIVNLTAGKSVTENANEVTSIASGVLVADLQDINSANTGVSLSASQSGRTGTNFQGRLAGATLTDQEINDCGIYRNLGGPSGFYEYVFDFPASHPAVEIDVYLCTTFSGQEDLDIDVIGATTYSVAGFSSSGNTTGAIAASSTAISPDGSNQITVRVSGAATSNFIYFNGIVLSPSTAVSGSATLAALTASGTAAVTTAAASGAASLAALTASGLGAVITPTSSFSDDFEAGGGNGALTGWTGYNTSALPASRVDGYYDSGDITAVGDTTWFNADRGRADWKLRPFPASSFDEYVFENVGVGPIANPQNNLAYSPSSHFAFCGIIVHDENLTNADYEFLVVGHRGATQSTLEYKRTNNNASNQGDENNNAVGVGVTHADIRLRLHSDDTMDWAYRAVGDTSWTLINSGTGKPQAGDKSWSSGNVYVGMIAYAFSGVPIDFVGTVGSAALVGENGVAGSGSPTLGALSASGAGSSLTAITASGAATLSVLTAVGVGSSFSLVSGAALAVLPSLGISAVASVSGNILAAGSVVVTGVDASGVAAVNGSVSVSGNYTDLIVGEMTYSIQTDIVR